MTAFAPRTPGTFISFEGIDGAGKSSHIDALAQRLRDQGHEVHLTREPGGTRLAEQLRQLILHDAMDPLTEAMLLFAGRRDHVVQVIRPLLERGVVVLCDRFADSSFAYQGGGRGFDWQVLTQLEQWAVEDLKPDITVWFDLPSEVAARRRAAAREADKFEAQDLVFFDKVRQGFMRRLHEDPARFVRLDANQSKEAVWADMLYAVESRLQAFTRPARACLPRP